MLVKLIVLFPHKGDDDIYYEPGMHREVLDTLVESYLRPVGVLQYYMLFEAPKPVQADPLYQPELEARGFKKLESKEPETGLEVTPKKKK